MNHILVSESSYNIRRASRQSLAGNWKNAIITSLLFAAVTILPAMFAILLFGEDFGKAVGNLYALLVGGPFCFGISYFFLKLFRKQETKPSDVFYGFDFFIKAFLLYVVTTIFIILWTLLLIIPGIVAAYRYRLAFLVLIDNPNLSTMEAINESKRLMSGNKGKLFFLDLSFIGWALLSCLTFGIGFIALLPYVYTATVVFYELCNGNISPRSVEINYDYKEKATPPVSVLNDNFNQNIDSNSIPSDSDNLGDIDQGSSSSSSDDSIN
jgi:uncharacterized membrane protein